MLIPLWFILTGSRAARLPRRCVAAAMSARHATRVCSEHTPGPGSRSSGCLRNRPLFYSKIEPFGGAFPSKYNNYKASYSFSLEKRRIREISQHQEPQNHPKTTRLVYALLIRMLRPMSRAIRVALACVAWHTVTRTAKRSIIGASQFTCKLRTAYTHDSN
jgi:hypothetical protein